MTLRLYAQYHIYNNYLPYIENIVKCSNIKLLPSIQLGSRFTFEDCDKNTYSIFLIRELEQTRELQYEWFVRMTNDVVANTTCKTLIIIFSTLHQEIYKDRIKHYQQLIPNTVIHHVDLEDWIDENTDLTYLKNIVNNFIRL